MDRDLSDLVEEHMRALNKLFTAPPPLLTLTVLADGSGFRYKHPMLMDAEAGTLEDAEAATRLVRALLVELVAHLDGQLDTIVRASTRDTHNVVDSL